MRDFKDLKIAVAGTGYVIVFGDQKVSGVAADKTYGWLYSTAVTVSATSIPVIS